MEASDVKRLKELEGAAVIDATNAELKKSPRAGFWKRFGRMLFKGFAFNHMRVYRVY